MIRNITPDHFSLSDGCAALQVDERGYPHIAPNLTDPADAGLAAVALAIYSRGPHDEAARAQIEVWINQYKPNRG